MRQLTISWLRKGEGGSMLAQMVMHIVWPLEGVVAMQDAMQSTVLNLKTWERLLEDIVIKEQVKHVVDP